jgi:hypothetical protein
VNRIGRRWAPGGCSRLASASRRFTFIAPQGFSSHPKTRGHVALLGPCFKTGQMKPPTANSLKRRCDPRVLAAGAQPVHYRSSPRERPLPERGWSSHEGLRRRVEATLSSVASELLTIGYTTLTSPLEAGQDTTRPQYSTLATHVGQLRRELRTRGTTARSLAEANDRASPSEI